MAKQLVAAMTGEFEPEKYKDSRTLTELVLEGSAPASVEDLRAYMGVEEGWGGNLFEKDAWKDWETTRDRG